MTKQISARWKITPYQFGSEVPFGEKPESVMEFSRRVEKAYRELEGSAFQPDVIEVETFGTGKAVAAYLMDAGLPVTEVFNNIPFL